VADEERIGALSGKTDRLVGTEGEEGGEIILRCLDQAIEYSYVFSATHLSWKGHNVSAHVAWCSKHTLEGVGSHVPDKVELVEWILITTAYSEDLLLASVDEEDVTT